MALYEHIFVCRQDISQQQVETLMEKFGSVVAENGGKIGKTEYWGLRNMAYRIRKNRKGHYSLMNIDAPHAAVAEMERQMRLTDDIIRFMTIRVEEHDNEPSAPMQMKNRERTRDKARLERFDDAAIEDMEASLDSTSRDSAGLASASRDSAGLASADATDNTDKTYKAEKNESAKTETDKKAKTDDNS